MRTRLKENEKAVFQTTLHWYFLVIPFLITTLLIILSFYLLLGTTISPILPLIIFSASILYLTYKIFERKFNIWVITDLRLIDEEGVFTVRVKESPVDKINNVTYVQGFIGRMLGFGNVEIQTAAEQGATVYNGIASPKQLSEALTTVQENYKRNIFAAQIKNISKSPEEEDSSDSMECPFCAEKIKVKAKICRYCGRDIPAK